MCRQVRQWDRWPQVEGQTIAKISLPLLQHCCTSCTSFTVAAMKELELLGFVSEIKELRNV